MGVFSKSHPEDSSIRDELIRLNNNIERYLRHLGVPTPASPEQIAISAVPSLFVGEPASEIDLAIREHAELRGITQGAEE